MMVVEFSQSNKYYVLIQNIMLKLWSLEEATVHQLLDLYDHPKPAFNTVSTQIRILYSAFPIRRELPYYFFLSQQRGARLFSFAVRG